MLLHALCSANSIGSKVRELQTPSEPPREQHSKRFRSPPSTYAEGQIAASCSPKVMFGRYATSNRLSSGSVK